MLNANQQALLTFFNMMTTSLLAVISKKKEKRSIILNGMSPSNRELFTRLLCTKDIRHDPPQMSKFLKSLLGEKKASHIANYLHNLTNRWKGTFIEGAFCHFLAKGYHVSQRDRTLPGGFTLFMCILPKECQAPPDSYKENLEVMRELWSQDIGEESIERLAKMNLFLPRNIHHLETQIDTALKMLEELTVEEGCATKSLIVTHILRLLVQDTKFAIKIVYQLDTELHKQFTIFSEHNGLVINMHRSNESFAADKLCHGLYGLKVI
jgi:hypothetical protein